MLRNQSEVETRRLSHALGAEIFGVDLSGPLSDADVSAIQEVWNQHHILLFRGLDLAPEQITAFAERFGALDDHASTPFYRLKEIPQLLQVTNREIGGKPSETRNTGRNWHSDYAYTGRPAAASMLYCGTCPSVGGDTMFANMVRAYDDLSETYREILKGLDAVYDIGLVAGIGERDAAKTAEVHRLNPPIAHPAVRTHPLCGKRALYVSERVSHFHGMSPAESQPIIDYLCAHATRPENIYRHQWQQGDLICWDNRSSMHRALADFDPSEERYMLRATLLGEESGFVVN